MWKVTLVILTSTSMCKLGNIDHAHPTFTHFDTMEECQKMADVLDPKEGVRAICIEDLGQ